MRGSVCACVREKAPISYVAMWDLEASRSLAMLIRARWCSHSTRIARVEVLNEADRCKEAF